MIQINNVSKLYDSKVLFENISFSFSNKLYWLTGENGIGKSVFCRCIVGLEDFTQGSVEGKQTNILFLPEVALSEGWMTLSENIDLMFYYYGIKLQENKKKKIIQQLNIIDTNELASTASVGTNMKLGLSLIFLSKTWNIIILDETLSHIDIDTRKIIIKELYKRADEGTVVLIVNHGEIQEKEKEKIVKVQLTMTELLVLTEGINTL